MPVPLRCHHACHWNAIFRRILPDVVPSHATPRPSVCCCIELQMVQFPNGRKFCNLIYLFHGFQRTVPRWGKWIAFLPKRYWGSWCKNHFGGKCWMPLSVASDRSDNFWHVNRSRTKHASQMPFQGAPVAAMWLRLQPSPDWHIITVNVLVNDICGFQSTYWWAVSVRSWSGKHHLPRKQCFLCIAGKIKCVLGDDQCPLSCTVG